MSSASHPDPRHCGQTLPYDAEGSFCCSGCHGFIKYDEILWRLAKGGDLEALGVTKLRHPIRPATPPRKPKVGR